MRTSALFGAKNFGFFKIYGVSALTRGVEPVRTFCGQGGGSNFHDFLRISYMEGSLLVFIPTVLYCKISLLLVCYNINIA